LVELLIDRVIVTEEEEVEIRYVIPPDPSSEHVRFCHLRTDYSARPQTVQEHTELPGHTHHSPFLGVLASPGGYLLSVAPEVRIGAERSQDVVGAAYQEFP
jgi:hypothetical protein